MTDLPSTNKKERLLMVIYDRLLGSATLEAMETIEAEACAEKFALSHWRYHGFPNSLTSDRGSSWVVHFWEKLCQCVGIQQRLSTAFHNKVLNDAQEEALRQYCNRWICMNINPKLKDVRRAANSFLRLDGSGERVGHMFATRWIKRNQQYKIRRSKKLSAARKATIERGKLRNISTD
ncbi:hypothetical protein K3495_g2680 [Podosphaera aphanis]|nr:hypothetical protein K3495_g2680 [Podosphaera aphanis]